MTLIVYSTSYTLRTPAPLQLISKIENYRVRRLLAFTFSLNKNTQNKMKNKRNGAKYSKRRQRSKWNEFANMLIKWCVCIIVCFRNKIKYSTAFNKFEFKYVILYVCERHCILGQLNIHLHMIVFVCECVVHNTQCLR